MVKIYSKSFCPYCVKVKNILAEEDIDFVEIDVTEDPDTFDKIKKQTGFTTVPQVFLDDKFIGRASDIEILANEGRISDILK